MAFNGQRHSLAIVCFQAESVRHGFNWILHHDYSSCNCPRQLADADARNAASNEKKAPLIKARAVMFAPPGRLSAAARAGR